MAVINESIQQCRRMLTFLTENITKINTDTYSIKVPEDVSVYNTARYGTIDLFDIYAQSSDSVENYVIPNPITNLNINSVFTTAKAIINIMSKILSKVTDPAPYSLSSPNVDLIVDIVTLSNVLTSLKTLWFLDNSPRSMRPDVSFRPYDELSNSVVSLSSEPTAVMIQRAPGRAFVDVDVNNLMPSTSSSVTTNSHLIDATVSDVTVKNDNIPKRTKVLIGHRRPNDGWLSFEMYDVYLPYYNFLTTDYEDAVKQINECLTITLISDTVPAGPFPKPTVTIPKCGMTLLSKINFLLLVDECFGTGVLSRSAVSKLLTVCCVVLSIRSEKYSPSIDESYKSFHSNFADGTMPLISYPDCIFYPNVSMYAGKDELDIESIEDTLYSMALACSYVLANGDDQIINATRYLWTRISGEYVEGVDVIRKGKVEISSISTPVDDSRLVLTSPCFNPKHFSQGIRYDGRMFNHLLELYYTFINDTQNVYGMATFSLLGRYSNFIGRFKYSDKQIQYFEVPTFKPVLTSTQISEYIAADKLQMLSSFVMFAVGN